MYVSISFPTSWSERIQKCVTCQGGELRVFPRFEGLVIRPNAPSAELMPSIFSKMLPCSSCSLARQLVTPKCLSPLVGGLLSNPQPVQIYELRTKLLFWGKCVTKCGGSPIGCKVLDVRDINIKAAACNLHCG